MPNHHATIYISPTKDKTVLPLYLREPAAEVQHLVMDTLNIDAVRALYDDTQRRFPLPQHFVVFADMILHPAQNALLKLIEEPAHNVFFHFVLPTTAFLLPTVRSRVFIETGESVVPPQYEAFKTASYKDRLELIAEHATKKDNEWLRALLDGVANEKDTTLGLKRATELLATQFYGSGVSRKMLLEHMALSLPVGQNAKIL